MSNVLKARFTVTMEVQMDEKPTEIEKDTAILLMEDELWLVYGVEHVEYMGDSLWEVAEDGTRVLA